MSIRLVTVNKVYGNHEDKIVLDVPPGFLKEGSTFKETLASVQEHSVTGKAWTAEANNSVLLTGTANVLDVALKRWLKTG